MPQFATARNGIALLLFLSFFRCWGDEQKSCAPLTSATTATSGSPTAASETTQISSGILTTAGTATNSVVPVAKQWSLSNTTYGETYVNQPFVGNGYMGLRIPSAGNGYWVGSQFPDNSSSWPLGTPRYTSAMVAGYRGDGAFLSALPNWSPLTVRDSSASYNPQAITASQLSSYQQTTDMQNAVVTTSVVWTSPLGNKAKLVWTYFAHAQYQHLGVVRLDITPIIWNGTMSVDAFIDLRGIRRGSELSAQRRQDASTNSAEASMTSDSLNTRATIAFNVVVPPGLPTSNPLNTNFQSGLTWSFTPTRGQTYSFIKYVGIATAADKDLRGLAPSNSTQDIDSLARAQAAAAASGSYGTYDEILSAHESVWHGIWQSDTLVDDQHSNLQAIIHASEYMLFSNIRAGTPDSIAPAGLTSDNYAGMIFWDAETWMYPYMLLTHPAMAKSVVDYRYNNLPNALLNVQNEPMDTGATDGSYFPWTSGNGILSVDGGETPEIHLQADIALAQFQYYEATGDKNWLKRQGWPVLSAIANYYSTRITRNTNGSYSIKGVDGPDEFTHGATDAAYTNGGAIEALGFAIQAANILGYPVPPAWMDVQKNLVKPIVDPARNIILQYAGFKPTPTTQIKQADVVLLSYPMEYPMPTQLAINNLNFYSAITDPTGPAMTDSIHAIIAAQFGLSSFTNFFTGSYQPFVRGPYLNYNETSVLTPSAGQEAPAYTFLTGTGGFLQTLSNGFAGYRFRTDSIYLAPYLPRAAIEGSPMSRVYLKGLNWQGRVFDVDVRPDKTTVVLRSGPAAPVTTPQDRYTLVPGQSLTITTRTSN